MFSTALKSFSSNISSNYTLSPTLTAHAGAWTVFDGKHRKSGKAVSVFVFDRKGLESSGSGVEFGSSRSNAAARKKLLDEVVERLKKEANLLARLRHPSILELAEPVEDTRNGGLMFATEPVAATLAGALKAQDDGSRLHSAGVSSRNGESSRGEEKVEIDELEIQKGLLQVAKGLEFLHESAELVHGNLTPEAIYINAKSDWKIAGLAFSSKPYDDSTGGESFSEALYYGLGLPRSLQLNLDYTSPDLAMDNNMSAAADMFSLGLIIICLYNSPHESPVHTGNSMSTYKKIFSSSSTIPSRSNRFLCSKNLPSPISSDVLPRLITRRPANRMNAREFQESRFFDNILMSAIRFMDSLPTKTPNEKAQFMRGLPRILEQFPKPVLKKKVLPGLLEETKDREMLALILGNVFRIMKLLPSSAENFANKVLPKLREIFHSPSQKKGTTHERDTLKEAGLVVILENMSLVAENCSGSVFKDDILPIIHVALESATHSLVDQALGTLPTILAVLDFSTIKNDVFPIVASVFSKTSSLAIKIRGLEAFDTLCGGKTSEQSSSSKQNTSILDKYTIQEKIVPLMKGIKTKEPAVMMAALKAFRQIGKIVDSDFLAMDVLPILWSFSLGPLLNLEQFQEYMKLIKSLSARVEQEQTRKLRDLASNSASGTDSSRSNELMNVQASQNPFEGVGIEDDFDRLVLGKSTAKFAISSTGFDTPSSTVRPTINQPSLQSRSISTFASSLQPQQISRTVTPDQSLSGFAALKPTNSTGTTQNASSWNTMQPIQPMKSTQFTGNPWTGGQSPAFGSQNAWSMPAQGSSTNSQPTAVWATSNSGFSNGFAIKAPPGNAQNGVQEQQPDPRDSLI